MRRRKQKFTWFPVLPTTFGSEGGGSNNVSWYKGDLLLTTGTDPGDGPNTDAIPILPDATEQVGEAENQSLRDYVEGQDYILKRIVGKFNVVLTQGREANNTDFIVGAGFAVLPVRDDDNNPALPNPDYDPLQADNSTAPWIWRRTWVLSDTVGNPTAPLGAQANWQYGSVMDGPHIDTKSARRITREQRLFLCVSVANMGPFQLTNDVQLVYSYDVRVLGAMRKARNRSTFK